MNVTEHQATVAVDAAARRNYDLQVEGLDDLHRTVQLELRELVLPIVWAALEALPDPGADALREAAGRFGTSTLDGCLDDPNRAIAVQAWLLELAATRT